MTMVYAYAATVAVVAVIAVVAGIVVPAQGKSRVTIVLVVGTRLAALAAAGLFAFGPGLAAPRVSEVPYLKV